MKAEILELLIEVGDKKHYMPYLEAQALYHALEPIFGKTKWLSDVTWGSGTTGTVGTMYGNQALGGVH